MGSRETPGALRKGNKTVRFSDTLVNTDELDNHQVLQLHRRVLDEQDESLDRLSESIRNQRELSIQIGDELDGHVQLLDEVDVLVDRHQDRLNGAKKRLNSVAQTAKDHGSLVVIAILIITLILLIVAIK
jgi:syntaxin 8